MTGYTVGTWGVRERVVNFAPTLFVVYRVGSDGKRYQVLATEDRDEAYLIAAAPALLKACKSLSVEWVDVHDDTSWKTWTVTDWQRWFANDLVYFVDRARAAIAEATTFPGGAS